MLDDITVIAIFLLRAVVWAVAACLALALILLALLAAFVAGVLLWARYEDPRGRLPEQVETTRPAINATIVAANGSCLFYLYLLKDQTTAALRDEGLAFLGDSLPPKNDPRDSYGPWRETPLLLGGRNGEHSDPDGDGNMREIKALRAGGECSIPREKSQKRALPPEIETYNVYQSLREPGGFYALTRNGEGMVIIDPRRELAVFLLWE